MDMAEVGKLAQEELGVDVTALERDTPLADAGISSVDMVMFVYALEEKLGIELAEEELRKPDTVGELLDLIALKARGV
jgi:acyl carrier protein